jgi:hypothetical protein
MAGPSTNSRWRAARALPNPRQPCASVEHRRGQRARRTTDGVLRAADGEQPADPAAVQRYLAKAFGDHLDEARQAMGELASRYEPAELNRIGFRLYEKFRPDVPYGNEGWGKRAVLGVELIRAAT